MGKGGQLVNKTGAAVATEGTTTEKRSSDMDHLTTADLRKWARSYALNLDAKVIEAKKSKKINVEELSREEMLTFLEPYKGGVLDADRPPMNLPLTRPTFTKRDIEKALLAKNPDIFKHSLFTSFWYLFSDLAMVAVIGTAAYLMDTSSLPYAWLLWPVFWYAQGSVMTGLWVLAHECGHGGFAKSTEINYWVGTLVHSALLVPFHSWRITHKKHHANTGSCEHDEVFAPATRSDFLPHELRETPLAQALGIITMLTVGWIPGYLVMNFSGPKKYKGKNANHFSSDAVFFDEEDRELVVSSVNWWIAAFSAVVYAGYTYGFRNLAFYYLIPYFITNYHLVLITYLQHTDVYMPHFRDEEWDFLRGALCTVDRSFGPLLDHTFHHIVDTHVFHHLFSAAPFYKAAEATEVFKEVLGDFYLKDETPIGRALFRAFSNCQFVEDEGKVVFYKAKL